MDNEQTQEELWRDSLPSYEFNDLYGRDEWDEGERCGD